MIYKRDFHNTQHYLDDLLKRLLSFLETAPILVSVSLEGDKVIIEEPYRNIVKEWVINFNIPTKENIRFIKENIIYPLCPVMEQVIREESEYSPVEILHMIDDEIITEDQLFGLKKVVEHKIPWRLEKIFLNKSNLIIRNLQTNKAYVYKMRFPLMSFLKMIRESITKENIYDFLIRNSSLEKELA